MKWLAHIPTGAAVLTPKQLAATRHSHLAPLAVRDTLVATIYQAWHDRDQLEKRLEHAGRRNQNLLERARIAEAEVHRLAPVPDRIQEFEDRLDQLQTRCIVLDGENRRLQDELAPVLAERDALRAAYAEEQQHGEGLRQRLTLLDEAAEVLRESRELQVAATEILEAERSRRLAAENRIAELEQQLQQTKLDAFRAGWDAGAADVAMRNRQGSPAEAYLEWRNQREGAGG